jgi:hypothetical protein
MELVSGEPEMGIGSFSVKSVNIGLIALQLVH